MVMKQYSLITWELNIGGRMILLWGGGGIWLIFFLNALFHYLKYNLKLPDLKH